MSGDNSLALIHATAGSAGAIIAMFLLYPLDLIRTRLQIQRQDVSLEYTSMWDCGMKIWQKEGWRALFQGLRSGLVGIAISNYVYFYWYTLLKASTLRSFKKSSLTPWQNVLVASIAGVLNVFCTMPVWVVNTRMKVAHYDSITQCAKEVRKHEGLRGFYRGLFASLALVSNPVIQFVAYEQSLKSLTRSRRGNSHMSALDYFALGAWAKAVATFATYPYQVLKSRQQASEGEASTMGAWALSKKMLREEGLSAFYGGMGAKLVQTVLTSALLFLCYEKIVRLLVKGTIILRKSSHRKSGLTQDNVGVVASAISVIGSAVGGVSGPVLMLADVQGMVTRNSGLEGITSIPTVEGDIKF